MLVFGRIDDLRNLNNGFMDIKKSHGGARAGAGRPKGDSKMVSSGSRETWPHAWMPNRTRRISFAGASVGSIVPAMAVKTYSLPFFDTRVVAGFPVPLDSDERSQDIDLLRMLCPHPEASYLVRVNGDSMIDAGVISGDIVIVDKSNRNPTPKEIAVCELNGEFTLKHFIEEDGEGWLVPANPDYPRLKVTPEDDFSIWGTVTYIIHKTRD